MKSIGELVIDLDAELKTDEQLNVIGKIADYLENVNYRNSEEESKMTDEVFTDLKLRLRAYQYNMVSLDDIFGYMQCLVDLGYLKMVDVRFIIECLCSKDSTDVEWIFK